MSSGFQPNIMEVLCRKKRPTLLPFIIVMLFVLWVVCFAFILESPKKEIVGI